MQFTIVSVYDRAAGVFGQPVFVVSKGAAIRSFSDEVNRDASDNQLNRHPDDFDLWCLGSFDDNTSEFHVGTNEVLVRAKDVFNPKQQ